MAVRPYIVLGSQRYWASAFMPASWWAEARAAFARVVPSKD